MAVVWWILGILLGVLCLILLLAVLAALLRWRICVFIRADGLDVTLKTGVAAQKLSPIGYTAHIYKAESGWKYELTGPFSDKIKALIDSLLSGKGEEKLEAAAEKAEKAQPPELPPLAEEFIDILLSKLHIEKYAASAVIGIKDDAMACAMTCGTVNMFFCALSAILVSRFILDAPPEISVAPDFDRNRLKIRLELKISLRLADALRVMLKKRIKRILRKISKLKLIKKARIH